MSFEAEADLWKVAVLILLVRIFDTSLGTCNKKNFFMYIYPPSKKFKDTGNAPTGVKRERRDDHDDILRWSGAKSRKSSRVKIVNV